MTTDRAPSPQHGVSFEGISKRYGSHYAVRDINIDVTPGEFVTLLGPSGSGKTTLLMLVAGFATPDSGRLLLNGRDISASQPHQRNIGVVFQSYALFPHLSVARNVAFPLEVRKLPKADIAARVKWALELVHMGAFAERSISQLSGGQQQRVALARAMVFKPELLLMDEPLAALDRNLRLEMQKEIRQLQQSMGQTAIYVTHDQEEALNLSDRIAVMNAGQVAQIATPKDLYMKPASPFVAKFFGEATLIAGSAAQGQLQADNGMRLPIAPADAGNVVLCVRPEQVFLDDDRWNFPDITGTVLDHRYLGSVVQTTIDTPFGLFLSSRQSNDLAAPKDKGSRVKLSWDPKTAHVMTA